MGKKRNGPGGHHGPFTNAAYGTSSSIKDFNKSRIEGAYVCCAAPVVLPWQRIIIIPLTGRKWVRKKTHINNSNNTLISAPVLFKVEEASCANSGYSTLMHSKGSQRVSYIEWDNIISTDQYQAIAFIYKKTYTQKCLFFRTIDMIRLGGSAPAVPSLSAISFWIRRWEEKDHKRAPSNPIDKMIIFTYLSDETVKSKIVREVTYVSINKNEQHAGSNCCCGMYGMGATPWWGRSCWATEEETQQELCGY